MREYCEILRLVWPLALGMVNNAVMQFVDRAFLARESIYSLEAALPASMLALTIAGFFQSVTAYSGTFVAQFHGAGDKKGEDSSYAAGTIIAVISGILALALIPAGRLAMPLMSDNPEVLARANIYYAIIMAGTIATCGHIAASSYFTGIGKTGRVFWIGLAGNILNIALDYLLIFEAGLGIAGAAYATVISSIMQWATLGIMVKWEKPTLELIGRILRFGIPSGGYTILNIISFTIFVFITGKVGDVEFAVSNACFSINWLLIAPMEGFAIGASTLVGQHQGRRDSEGARRVLKKILVLALSFVVLLSTLAVIFNHSILSLFAPTGTESALFYSLGFKLVLLMAAWQIFDAADVVVAGALKGAGDTKFVMWWMVAVAFGIWLPLVWLVKATHNTMPALWATMVVYVVIICAGEILRWRRGKWSAIKLT